MSAEILDQQALMENVDHDAQLLAQLVEMFSGSWSDQMQALHAGDITKTCG